MISLGYIAGVSRHSRGDTVDLTLVALPAKRVPAFKRDTTYGPCAGPADARAPDNSIDMGTSFDCFDPLSHTKAAELAPEQAQWRQVLVDAMAQQGFHNYPKEWWHFTHMSRAGWAVVRCAGNEAPAVNAAFSCNSARVWRNCRACGPPPMLAPPGVSG